MKHKYWYYLFCVFVASLFTLTSLPVFASSAELPKGMVIGDENGISVQRDGTYLIEVNDVMPGKKWHSSVSIINMEKDIPYRLTMLISPPTVTGKLDLSKEIQMKLTYENKVVYEGPVSGIGSDKNLQKDVLDLGTFKAGDSRALEVNLFLSGDYTNEDFSEKNVMENIWTFKAVKTTLPDTSNPDETPDNPAKEDTALPGILKPLGKLPQTGEEWRQALLTTCLGLFLLMLILLLWKSHRKLKEK